MDYTKLYYFYTVAKYSHVTRAAEELHLAQPALTKAIRTLENEIGTPLLAKSGRNVILTPAGHHLKQRLDEIVPRMLHLQEDMTRFARNVKHTVRLNVLAASTLVTEAVVAYRKEHKSAEFQLIQNETDEFCQITLSTSLPLPSVSDTEDHVFICREPIYLAVPSTSVYASYPSVSLSQVKDEAFVSLAGSRGFRSICDEICRRAGFSPKTVFESDSLLAVQNFIGASLGVGFWPAYSWGNETRFGIVRIPISSPDCARGLTLKLHAEREPSPAAKDFFTYLREYLKRKATDAEKNNQ